MPQKGWNITGYKNFWLKKWLDIYFGINCILNFELQQYGKSRIHSRLFTVEAMWWISALEKRSTYNLNVFCNGTVIHPFWSWREIKHHQKVFLSDPHLQASVSQGSAYTAQKENRTWIYKKKRYLKKKEISKHHTLTKAENICTQT